VGDWSQDSPPSGSSLRGLKSLKQPRIYDWHGIKMGLRLLHQTQPEIYDVAVLVGGGACWFYRMQLKAAKDADFKPRIYSTNEEMDWLSKDADFTNIEPELLPRDLEGFPVGSVQFGVRVDPEEYFENAKLIDLEYHDNYTFRIFVAHPLDLWKEKTALITRVRRVQDPLHIEVLAAYCLWELCDLATRSVLDSSWLRDWSILSHRLRNYAPELLTHPALLRRLAEPALVYPEIARFVENEIKPRQLQP
jgi:hypothetical protein